ncbi:MAG TPA: hypothetical protein VMT71_11130 [Syntrophorhabdales bacterium]|nr:hypothetical protein [Syntrophorhabdales bacterium]
MAKHRGQFKGEKRRKELVRLQKQEEKRQRRFGIKPQNEPGSPTAETENLEIEKSSTDETQA